MIHLFMVHMFHVASCEEGDLRVCTGTDTDCVVSDSDNFLIDDRLSVGRVEVCSGGRYGTICDDSWTDQAASVACRQLSFSPYGMYDIYTFPATASSQRWSGNCTGAVGLTNEFGEENHPIAINFLNCNGTEERLVDCNRNTNELTRCGRFEDAGVVCQSM